jgi:5-methylcytosine-specific restriction endonuclease McrA
MGREEYNIVPRAGKPILRSRISLEQQAEIVARWEFKDVSLQDLADEFGCSTTLILYVLDPRGSNVKTMGWAAKNKEKVRESTRKAVQKWTKLNPEKARKYAAAGAKKRYALMKCVPGNGWGTDWDKIVERWGGMCVYCQAVPADTVDHIVPVSRGGTNYRKNLVPACRSCNSSKSARDVHEFCPDRADEIIWLAQALAEDDEIERT